MTNITDIKKRFFSSIIRGTGEAYFILKEHPTIDFSNPIIRGAINNYAYDQQCEGSRAFYINRLIQKSKQKEYIITTILKKLQQQKNDYYNLSQMCDLAVLFYKNGINEAAKALRKRFDKNAKKSYQFCGQSQIIEIDGMSGLLKVAEMVGEILYHDEDDSESCWRVEEFQNKNKDIDVYAALEKAAAQNKYIKTYLASILADKNRKKERNTERILKFTYEYIKEQIDSNSLLFLRSKRNNELSEEEVEKLANEFLLEKDKTKKERYLRFFSTRKFPFHIAPILKIAKGKKTKKNRLVEWAVEALKHFESEELREFAIEKISTSEDPSDYLKLLVSNYKEGDYKLLVEVANKYNNYEYIHNLVFGFIAIYEKNATAECKEPLEAIYNKINCGLHREDIIKILAKNEVLSDNIFKELEFDSYEPVRKLYKKLKKKG